MPIVIVSSGRGRSPSAGAVADRTAISTRASARRCVAVRRDPVAVVLEAQLFADAVEFGFDDLTAEWVERAVDDQLTAPTERGGQVSTVAHAGGVAVGGVAVGELLPVLDPRVGDVEGRAAAQLDEELFRLGELGVAPVAVARGDEVDVGAGEVAGGVRLAGCRHRVEVSGTMHEAVTVTAPPVCSLGRGGRPVTSSRRRPRPGGDPTCRRGGTRVASNRVANPPMAVTASCSSASSSASTSMSARSSIASVNPFEQAPSHTGNRIEHVFQQQPVTGFFFPRIQGREVGAGPRNRVTARRRR